ncbi:VanZ family protein [Paenibacillus sp. P32E]|uniref:VanZ family protein n=1 Tax=Paenibacillus sp. P32E TaxID=1349434 RepID=UPI0015C086A2|nr:VanZ family protein [Paenibacillus sp. P32E]
MNPKKTVKYIFIFYLILVFNFVIIKFFGDFGSLIDRIKDRIELIKNGYWHLQIRPFETLWPSIKLIMSGTGGPAMHNLIANVIVFIPMGLLIPMLLSKPSFVKAIGISIGLIATVELLQFITLLGVADIDDVIVNTSGAIIGYIFYSIVKTFITSIRT